MKQQYTTTAIKKQLNNKNNTTATSNINNMVIVITLKKSNSQIKKLKLKKPSYTVFTDTNPQLEKYRTREKNRDIKTGMSRAKIRLMFCMEH